MQIAIVKESLYQASLNYWGAPEMFSAFECNAANKALVQLRHAFTGAFYKFGENFSRGNSHHYIFGDFISIQNDFWLFEH
jgi:hypothetical protein